MPDYPTTPLTPDAVTPNYGFPLWGPDQPADVGRTINVSAASFDAGLAAAVAAVINAERHYALMLMGA